jgi:hypothetical protein
MIEPHELRIGNWVNLEGNVLQVDGRVICDVWMEEFASIDPIPLTEEWLLKLGFINTPKWPDDDCTWSHGGFLHFRIDMGVPAQEAYLDLYEGTSKYIQYVHQIQNLYFALTGSELTIKE